MKAHRKLTTAQAVGVGLVAGMRSMRLPALLARGRDPGLAAALQWAAAGELLLDKAPFTPSRTRPLSLIARMLIGAGSVVALAPPRQPIAGPAFLAAGAALGSSFALARLRAIAPGGSSWVTAFAEDALAASLGRRLVG